MKKHLLLITILVFCTFFSQAQTLNISDEIYIGSSEGYGLIGKYNDRILFYNLDDNKVKLKAYDSKLHKIWEKDIEPDRKNSAKVLDILGNKQEFNVIYQFRKKGHNYIKIHKYDAQVKLLDSAIIKDWGRNILTPNFEIMFSEDKKVAMVYEIENSTIVNAIAINLDSLTTMWFKTFDVKEWGYDNNFHQVLLNNNAEAFFIQENENRLGTLEKHRFVIKQLNSNGMKVFEIPMKNNYSINVKFRFDNVNQRLTAAGLYSTKSYGKALGYFLLNIPPEFDAFKLYYQPFDDEFVSSLFGKKIMDNKGIPDLRVQEIVHRRDGGILAVIEQVREIERQPISSTGRMFFRNDGIRSSIDFYYDNIFVVSMSLEGSTDWKSIFYKKQASQDDDARYCSYFLVKTPSALRFLFNDEIERSTTVSEYVLNAAGQNERHAIMNTEGQNINLRFRDALQVSANEIIVPSDDRRRVKLVKIQY